MAYQIYGRTVSKQGQVKFKTISSYLFTLKFYHVNRHFNLEAFNTPCIALIIKDRERLFFKQKTTCLRITKDNLKKIIANKPINIDKLNINTTFKVIWVGLSNLGKITYTSTKFKKALFSSTKVTRSNISFAKSN